MAMIQVILHGIPGGTVHDTDNYPVVLKFSEGLSFEDAIWVIPSYPGNIPGDYISEIRVTNGPLQIMVDGPDGFQSGPYDTTWVRGGYPRGKLCSFLQVDNTTRKTGGVMVDIHEGSIIVEDLIVPGMQQSAGT
ncbi:MAG: hypothetical protein GEU75_14230 [Dehalococcoidia bacterium]|nr:hypothetical protein [Dehalococcoidia bacterium]